MENPTDRPERPQRPQRPVAGRRFYDAQNRPVVPKRERPGGNPGAYRDRRPDNRPERPDSYRSLDDFDRRDPDGQEYQPRERRGNDGDERGEGRAPFRNDRGEDRPPFREGRREDRGGDRGGRNYSTDSRSENPRNASIEMLFGLRPILEALSAGRTLEKIFLLRGTKNSLVADISTAARAANIPVQQVPSEKLDGLTRKNHQGAVAFVSPIDYVPLDGLVTGLFEEGKVPFLLLLDRITDIRNFGAMARTAECLGVQALVVPVRGAAQMNGDALKTSAGALNRLPVCRENDLRDTIQMLQQSGIAVVACTEKADEAVGSSPTDFSGPVAVLMGSEEDGISPELLRLCDHCLRIPMTGQIQSLNVGVAAGIMLFEIARQRGSAKP